MSMLMLWEFEDIWIFTSWQFLWWRSLRVCLSPQMGLGCVKAFLCMSFLSYMSPLQLRCCLFSCWICNRFSLRLLAVASILHQLTGRRLLVYRSAGVMLKMNNHGQFRSPFRTGSLPDNESYSFVNFTYPRLPATGSLPALSPTYEPTKQFVT